MTVTTVVFLLLSALLAGLIWLTSLRPAEDELGRQTARRRALDLELEAARTERRRLEALVEALTDDAQTVESELRRMGFTTAGERTTRR